MKLREFIKGALLDISNGVEDANEVQNQFKIIGDKHESGIDGNLVDFDVSVIADEELNGKVKGEAGASWLNVVTGKVGGEIGASESHQSIHRLNFKVYISEKIIEK